ncbi:hypothetical protein ABPG74_002791 [Tetrahymena malaccensis]
MEESSSRQGHAIQKKFFNPQYTLPIAFGCLGLASYKFYGSMKTMFLINNLKKKFKLAKPVSQMQKGDSEKYNLAYLSGKLQYDKNSNLFDYHFGIKPVNQDSIGLLRKVEVYQTGFLKSSGQFIDQREKSYLQNMLNEDPQNQHLQTEVFTKGKLTIENNMISGSLLEQQSTEEMKKIDINFEEISNYVKQNFQLKENEEEKEKKELDLLIKEGVHSQESHPYRQLNQRQIVQENNFIYFKKTPNQFTKGDIRISFYEIKQLDEVTVLAGFKDNILDPVVLAIPGFNNYTRKIMFGNRVQTIKLTQIKYVLEGLIPQKDLIESITFQLQKDERFYKLFYFVLIYLLYNYIENEVALQPELASPNSFARFYIKFKEYVYYDGLKQIFSFDESLKSMLDDSKFSAALHYGATQTLIRIGPIMTSLVFYAYYTRRNELDEVEKQQQQEKDQNNQEKPSNN